MSAFGRVPIVNTDIRLSDKVLKDAAERMWEMMFAFPVIVPCVHCNTANAVTNPSCVRCGAPMGRSLPDIQKHAAPQTERWQSQNTVVDVGNTVMNRAKFDLAVKRALA